MNQMIKQELNEASFKGLINDIDFEEIEFGLKTPNIFRILNISKTEIRHSNFLSWLLDPYESHNLREAFLKRFLSDISVELDVTLFESIEIRREWRNIDILIISENSVICIENKVESNEHSDQLSRYKRIVKESFPDKKNIFVYLTPNRNEASDNEYISYSYEQIADILKRIIALYSRNLIPEVLQYLKDYVETLNLEIMQTHKLNTLATQLYNKHKETLDFIFENRPDIANDFYKIFEKKVIESGWATGSINKGVIRFLTPKLKEMLPPLRGYSQKESFVFELDFFWMNQKTLCFKTVIPPGDETNRDETIRKILSDCIENTGQAKKPNGKKWLVHFIEKHPFILEEMQEKTDEQIYKQLEPFWKKITDIVHRVEDSIFLRSEELKSLF